ncbi:DNA-binding protein [Fomitiporia mediterranea MF3/22]|uniref:DNA-binding protein n=1 Tax=Fomitiporia mediterranea (strain MF3/22) TaxID=694068 RepID=UPI000440921C|nr:DNA-binding protein [Fomitiporia mediterranea MF3/22]EJD02237.1 DNA-binding protein [Fomitiporia mediterranea MF3/22]
MQAQSLRQQARSSSQQSLAVIKTLLSASFGCIAYLRNLLPDENFGEARLTSGLRGSMAFDSQETSINTNSRLISGVRVKTVTRGYSTEADKLLNYLEHGIFDAIERQYLKSFIFAIYLDNADPNNIVESYTYNLTYYTVPGTSTTVPVMSLDDRLNDLSLNPSSKLNDSDAVAKAISNGKAPTLGDVKQSVKDLVKKLIVATQSLDPLPKRRFATFKLFYRENTPQEYEPPYFRPGDPEKDKFVFTTHGRSEVPEKFSIGAISTPYHGIDLQVQSVVKFLPNDAIDESQYLGIEEVTKKGFGALQRATDTTGRSRQLEDQRKDAEERKFAWSAEDSKLTNDDADGEADPDYINDSGIGFGGLLGLRKADGSIAPIEREADDAMDIDESSVKFFGKPDVTPTKLGQLGAKRIETEDLEATQQLESTQARSLMSTAPGYPNRPHTALETLGIATADSRGIDTQALKAIFDQSAADKDEILDIETQVENHIGRDYTKSHSQDHVDDSAPKTPLSRASDVRAATETISCACGHEDDDDVVFCEACGKWLHIRCMGYLSANDSRLPQKYVCIPCRLRGDVKFDLIKHTFPEILAAYEELINFRRAIKIAEEHSPGSLKVFRKLSKCNASLAEQLWNRLEHEGGNDFESHQDAITSMICIGFISLEVTETDSLGLLETRSRGTRSTARKVKSAKQIQKYVFHAASKKTALYRDYFSPDSEAERSIIKLGRGSRREKTVKRKETAHDVPSDARLHTQVRGAPEGNPVSTEDAQDAQLHVETQTQDDTQLPQTMVVVDMKRRSEPSSDARQTSKKLKISVVEENVDIEG